MASLLKMRQGLPVILAFLRIHDAQAQRPIQPGCGKGVLLVQAFGRWFGAVMAQSQVLTPRMAAL
jgi:hypothetical protein